MKVVDEVLDIALKESKYIKDIRRELHQYPEPGFKEFKTQEIIINELKREGIEYKKVANTGVLAIVNPEKKEKIIAVRADIDGLPVTEENDIEYKSKNHGFMHACGHDAHTAIVLSLAKVLNKFKDRLEGQVRLLFQPAEEGQGGAIKMIEDGVLDGVDKIIALHVDSSLQSGYIKAEAGPIMAASDSFLIKIIGKGGHAASPYKTIDPILIASRFVCAVQDIISRRISPLDSAVITIATFNSGVKENVIPEIASLSGTVRTFSKQDQEFIKTKLEDLLKYITKAFDASYQFDYNYGYPVVVNSEKVTKEFIELAKEVLDEKYIITEGQKTMGAEDFAYYLEKVPGVMFRLGTSNKDKSTDYPHHHPKFNVDEDVLYIGLALFLKFIFKNLYN